MTREDFTKAMTFLGIAYNKEFTQEQVAVWFEFFKDVDLESYKMAIKRIVAKNKFIPSIHELKKELALIKTPMLELKAEQEWEEVIKAMRKYGSYRPVEALSTLSPYTKRIVQMFGWGRLCESTYEQLVWLKKDFVEAFEAKQDNAEEILSLGDGNLTMTELKKMVEENLKEPKLIEQ